MPVINLCGHGGPFSFHTVREPKINCPVCLIKKDIAAIQIVQKHVKTNGGVFYFRKGPSTNPSTMRDKYRDNFHDLCMRRWHKTKLDLMEDVAELEKIIQRRVGNELEKKCVEALGILEKKWEDLCVVPGADGEEMETETGSSLSEREKAARLLSKLKETKKATQGDASTSTKDGVTGIAPGEASTELPLQGQRLHRVRFADTVKIFPSGSPAGKGTGTAEPLTMTLSGSHSVAEKRWFKCLFFQNSQKNDEDRFRRHSQGTLNTSYKPGTWASPAGHQKIDTSMMNLSWQDIEDIQDPALDGYEEFEERFAGAA